MMRLPPLPGTIFEIQEIRVEAHVFRARQAVGRAMDSLGGRVIRRTRLVTAASEIFRNGLIYGGGAETTITTDARDRMVWVECHDRGPGIADVALARRDGYTTGGGLGRGLGGAERLVDAFDLVSAVGEGTIVRMGAYA